MNDDDLIKCLQKAMPLMPVPSSLTEKIIAMLHPINFLRERILATPLTPTPKFWWRNPYFAASLLLHIAAAVVVVVLIVKLQQQREKMPTISINPTIVETTIPLDKIVAVRENRSAILTMGKRLGNGEIAVNIAQFADNAQLLLTADESLSCLRAYFSSVEINGEIDGVICEVVNAQLNIPQKFVSVFGDNLNLRIIEMDDHLEIWDNARYQTLTAIVSEKTLLATAKE